MYFQRKVMSFFKNIKKSPQKVLRSLKYLYLRNQSQQQQVQIIMRNDQTESPKQMEETSAEQRQKRSMISTEDSHLQTQFIKSSKFACDMIAVNNNLSMQERSELTCQQIYNLLLHNQSNFQKVLTIQGLRYVTADTKAQFTFLIMLYYLSWLQEISAFLQKRNSDIPKRYKNINCDFISMNSLHKLELYLHTERERISDAFFKCSQRVHATLHLINGQMKYFPRDFQKNVSNVALHHCLDFSKCKMQESISDIKQFFVKRIKKEYDYTRQNEQDDKIAIIESIITSFI